MSAPLARLREDQPGERPRCPHWCTGDHAFNVHGSETTAYSGIMVRLLQAFTQREPRIYISAGDIPASEAKNWAHTFAMAGQPELAARINRLGELAEAGAEFIPVGEPVGALAVHHEECTIGRRGGYVNPTTGRIVLSRLLEDQPAVSHG